MSSTPKPVVNAFFPDRQRIDALSIASGPLTLKPVTVGRSLLLEKLDSPFTRSAEEKKEKGDTATPMDWLRVVHVLTMPDEKLRSYYEGFDRAEFEAEVWTLSESLLASEMADLIPKVVEIFKHSSSTLIGAGGEPEPEPAQDAPDDDGKKKKTGSKASSARASQTASAGR